MQAVSQLLENQSAQRVVFLTLLCSAHVAAAWLQIDS
jgi:hypothetical protein